MSEDSTTNNPNQNVNNEDDSKEPLDRERRRQGLAQGIKADKIADAEAENLRRAKAINDKARKEAAEEEAKRNQV